MAMGKQAVSNGDNQTARAHFRQALNAAPNRNVERQIRQRIETLRKASKSDFSREKSIAPKEAPTGV